jgi:hypothetical protein
MSWNFGGEKDGGFSFGGAVTVTADRKLIAVGESKVEGQSGSGIYIVGIDANDALEWEKNFQQTGHPYPPV